MAAGEHSQTSEPESSDLFTNTSIQVRLPFMGKPGNAWAQRQEKERQLQMQQESSCPKDGNDKSPQSGSGRASGDASAVPHQNPEMPESLKTAPRKASFKSSLDYDEELALPMPKPRAASKQPLPSTLATQPAKRGGQKGRSFTEPADISASEGMNPKPLFVEKKVTEKKSKVASLKSKFSIKDIGKEAKEAKAKEYKESGKDHTKDTPKDKAKEKETAKQATNLPTDSEKAPEILGEPKLYVPKPKELGVVPLSAPPGHIPNKSHDSSSSSSSEHQQSRTVSSTPGLPPGPFTLRTPDKRAESNVEKLEPSPADTGTTVETPQANYVLPRERIEGMILGDHSLSPTRKGTYAITGNPEIVTSQPRIVSMRAEVEQEDGDSGRLQRNSGASDQQALYSPSVYNVSGGGAWEQMQREHPDTMPQYSSDRPSFEEGKDTQLKSLSSDERTKSGPVIVSSDQGSRARHPSSSHGPSSHTSLTPTAPAFTPNFMASGAGQYGVNPRVNENVFFGVTSHGGYAPPPPHPSYQNTISLEQQLAAHADSIHHHLSSAVNRLSKVFGDTNNWLMDQVLRNVENLGDTARLLTNRAVGQTEIASEARKMMIELRRELEYVRRECMETRNANYRLAESFHRELANLHMKIDALGAEVEARHAAAEEKGKETTRSGGKGKRYFTKRESSTREGRKGSIQSKVGEPSSAEGVSRTSTPAVAEQSQSDVPTPTAAFRTPSEHGDEEDDLYDGGSPGKQHQQKSSSRSVLDSTGSPESKKATTCSHSDAAPKTAPSSVSHEDTETPDKGGSTGTKTPRRRGMFGIGRRRDGENHSKFPKTPSRSKESNTKGLQVVKKGTSLPPAPPGVLPPPPQMAPSSTSNYPQYEPHTSPSSIHPALRNPHQQQIMREREQQQQHQQQHQNWYQGQHRSRHGHYGRYPSHGSSGYPPAGQHQPPLPGSHPYNPGFGFGSIPFNNNQPGSSQYINPPPLSAESNMPPVPHIPPPPQSASSYGPSTPTTPWPVGTSASGVSGPSGPVEGCNWYHEAYDNNNDSNNGRK